MTLRTALFFRAALRTGLPYGLFMGIFWYIQAALGDEAVNPWRPIIMAVISAIFFGAAMGWFLTRKKTWDSAKPTFADDESIILETPANHFMKIEAVGGRLYLTDRRLVFKSHHLNVQRHEFSIPLSDIAEQRPVPTMWVIPNGLLIRTDDEKTERFVIENRAEWIKKIGEAMHRDRSGS